MRKFRFKLVALALLAGTVSCEEKKEDINFHNIENLYAQPLPVIEKAILGKWKIVYDKGGIVANLVQYRDNYFVEFTANKQYIYSSPIVTVTAEFEWSKGISYYMSVDSMYVMRFNKPFIPPLVMERIYNDTLIFALYEISEMTRSYCIKSNL
jgi:hypothetical protein